MKRLDSEYDGRANRGFSREVGEIHVYETAKSQDDQGCTPELDIPLPGSSPGEPQLPGLCLFMEIKVCGLFPSGCYPGRVGLVCCPS